MNSMLLDGIKTRPTISTIICDSILIGLIALGVLPGKVFSKISNGIVMGFVAFSMLTRRARKAGKAVEIAPAREKLPTLNEIPSDSMDTGRDAMSEKESEFGRKSVATRGNQRGIDRTVMRPFRLVRGY